MSNLIKVYSNDHDIQNNYATDMSGKTVDMVVRQGGKWWVFYH